MAHHAFPKVQCGNSIMYTLYFLRNSSSTSLLKDFDLTDASFRQMLFPEESIRFRFRLSFKGTIKERLTGVVMSLYGSSQ